MDLSVIAGPDRGKSFKFDGSRSIVLGRSRASDAQLLDKHVSRSHCRFDFDQDEIFVVDLDSSSGTYVNGKRISRKTLSPGDTITVGGTQLRYDVAAIEDDSTLILPAAAKPDRTPAGGQKNELQHLVGQYVDRYEVLRRLANGASGTVFQARDSKEDRLVSLKVIYPQFYKTQDEMQKLVSVLSSMPRVDHDNIAQMFDAGMTDRYCWIASEYVPGQSLGLILDVMRSGKTFDNDWELALRVAIHVGRALQAAHRNGLVHSNIKPSKIVLRSTDNVIKLMDLTLGEALRGTLTETITRPGQLVGDVEFMAPERTRNVASVDIRADVYSLGATVYALLTGRYLFEGADLPDVIAKIRTANPVRPSRYNNRVSAEFEASVLKMIAKKPEDRYQTPQDLLSDLDSIQTVI